MQTAPVMSRALGLSVSIKRQAVRQSDSCLQTLSPRSQSTSRVARCFFSSLQRKQTCSFRICKGTNSADPLDTTSISKACASSARRTQSPTPLLTSCLPSIKCRTFTSASLSLFRYSTPLHKPSAINANNMSLKKDLVSEGDGKTYPKAGDTVTMEYTGTLHVLSGGAYRLISSGWLFDESKEKNRGTQYVENTHRNLSQH